MTTTEPRFAQPVERTYTIADLVRLTGATPKTLTHWVRTEALAPETVGRQWRFSTADLDVVYAAAAMLDFGMTDDAAITVARELAEHDRFHKTVGRIFNVSVTVSTPKSAETDVPQ